MSKPLSISPDDLLDILDLRDALEKQISLVLHDQQMNLAMSALIATSIKCVLSQCETLREASFYRRVFIEMLNNSIDSRKLKQ